MSMVPERPSESLSGVAAARPDQVVQYLLAHNYLLTALELLIEAQEAGDEDDVESLQHFFNDQAKFPAEAVAKFDPSEAINIQQLARKREERLGVLEYELRVAKEDLAEAQREGSATSMATGTVKGADTIALGPSPQAGDAPTPAGSEVEAAHNTLSLGERSLLNGAVRAYLTSQGYKLTALTFSEEGASNIPAILAPTDPTLLQMFQGNNQKLAAAKATEVSETQQQEAKDQAAAAEAKAAALQDALDAMTKEKARLRADMEYLQSQLDLVTQQAEAAACKDPFAQTSEVDEVAKQKVDKGDSSGPRLLGAEAALRVVAEQLPKIVPNMLINKRDDVVPMFLAVIEEHRNAAMKDKLTFALFNLVKKPNPGQRHLIADSCADLAARIGPSRTAEELLPQCWEQVNHRHAERRALVAEACGALAPHVASDMRASLILSILQQMAADSDAIVRRAMAQALAHLLPLLPDLHKFQAVQALLLQLAKDPLQDVVDTAFEQLVPALLAWMADTDLLYTALLPAILTDIRASISRCPYLAGTQEAVLQEGQAELRAVNDHQQRQVQILLRLYTTLLPNLRQAAKNSVPSWAGGHALADPVAGANPRHDALAAIIRQEADAVLNVGHVFHSEDEEVCLDLPTHVPPSVQASVPDSPCSSSAADACMRLSSAHSMLEEDEEARAPASSGSSLTQGNLDHMTASVSAAGKPPPSPTLASQPAGSSVTGQQHTLKQEQQQSPNKDSQPGSSFVTPKQQTQQQHQPKPSVSLLNSQTVTSAVQQAVDVHPLQAELQQPAPTSTQERTTNSQQAGTSAGMQAQYQSLLGTAPQAGDSEGMSGGQAFGAWASAEQHSGWAVMEWVATEALPALVGAVRMVGPNTETEALRRRFSAAFKATCLSFGHSFTADVIQPVFMASAAVPEQDPVNNEAQHHVQLIGKHQHSTKEGQRVGRLTVLPIMLSAVLPYAKLEGQAVQDFLCRLAVDGASGEASSMWVVQHIQEVHAAVRFACAFQEVQGPVCRVMRALQAHDTAAVRRCAVACATALTPCLPRHQVIQQVLPTLQRLSEDSDSTVQTAAIDGLAQLLPSHGSNPEMAGRLYSHFDELVTSNKPQIQLAVLQSLTAHVAQFGDTAMEFLLQKVLMVLTYLHRRAPGSVPHQLQSLAIACFTALRAADTCEVQSETVQLHLMAALQSLHREGELLPSTQREVLAVMLREHGATAAPHAHATDASLSHSRRSFRMGASSEGAGLASHLMASNQTPPGIPRCSTHTTSGPSELGPAISGGLSTHSKGNLGTSLLRRFNSGTPPEQPRRSNSRASSGTLPTAHDHANQH